eukprot:CAMPEP_0196598728 /NCGR_PEP_ID=MMETSP1081-20130531/94475_1 /TAXON_ID=36882 /ORGANISM="Pyramimonas amylifera, Strain CCMP720" /LENGTH=1208 /DNA_ID=CAMNT_0041924445 /DNA_START=44 /DNA_END=3670 /DNA_ORIENTATION=-
MMWFPNPTTSSKLEDSFIYKIDGCDSTDIALTTLLPSSTPNDLQPCIPIVESTWQSCSAFQGDDSSPPNAIKTENMNCLTFLSSSTVGWSSSAPRTHFDPISLKYELIITSNLSLQVHATFEYSNPFANDKQSMAVRLSILKQFLCQNQELELVSTIFEDLVDDKDWKDISTDITYAENAKEIVRAVMRDKNCGQTAGSVSSKSESVDVKLGPLTNRGRIKLMYVCSNMYNYDAMSVTPDPTDIGRNKIVPLGVFLPWTKLGDASGNVEITLVVNTPSGSGVLQPSQSYNAFMHLKEQSLMKDTALIVVDKLNPDGTFLRKWHCLPPTQCCILFWLEMPVAVDDYVDVAAELEMLSTSPVTKLDIYCPTLEDTSILKVSMPGAPSPDAQLFRMKVKLPEIGRLPSTKVRSVINLNFSDASGSTGRNVMTSSSGAVMGKESKKTIRDCFNMFGERRFLKRLSSIPALLHANVLRKEDIWTDVTYAFDHGPVDTFSLTFLVGDLGDQIFVDSILIAAKATRELTDNKSTNLVDTTDAAADVVQNVMSNSTGCAIITYLKRLRMIKSNGGTDFESTADTAIHHFKSLQDDIQKLIPDPSTEPLVSTFVDFDTDGGHNGSIPSCLDAVDEMVSQYKVCNGVVYGFGDWLDQDCASKLARRIGSVPALLALHIPEPGQEGLNVVFRRGFTAWLDSLRSIPMKVIISAGAVAYTHGSRGIRHLNAIEVIALRHVKCLGSPFFSAPDVSDVHSTKAVVENLCGGDEVVFLVASRIHDPNALLRRLILDIGEEQISHVELKVQVQPEALFGCSLAHEWLRVLTSDSHSKTKEAGDLCFNSSVAVPRLLARMEDDVAFAFNLASRSGATSYLGRSNTNLDRAPIDAAHEPQDPSKTLILDSYQHGPRVKCSIRPQVQLRHRSLLVRSDEISTECRSTLRASSIEADRDSDSDCLELGCDSISFPTYMASKLKSIPRCSRSVMLDERDLKPRSNIPSATEILNGSDFLRTHASKQVGDVYATIRFSCNMLTNNSKALQFSCDFCSQKIPKYTTMFHCMSCENYNECAKCAGKHIKSHPLHVVVNHTTVNRGVALANQTQAVHVDPLLDELLGPVVTKQSPVQLKSKCNQPTFDRALEVCEQRVQYLLTSMLQWWPIVNKNYTNGRYPEALDAEMVRQIQEVLSMSQQSPETMSAKCALATTIVDSLERMAKNKKRSLN